MADPQRLFGMLLALVEQTEFGNLEWRSVRDGGFYLWTGSSAAVALRSMNGDEDYPIKLTVHDSNGDVYGEWTTEATTKAETGELWDNSVRKLWSLVHEPDNPVTRILKDLEALPPF